MVLIVHDTRLVSQLVQSGFQHISNMKNSSAHLFISLAFTFTALSTSLTGHSIQGPATDASRVTSGIVNVPLIDWIKNGNTDLQWYTTISVGSPPQNL